MELTLYGHLNIARESDEMYSPWNSGRGVGGGAIEVQFESIHRKRLWIVL